MINPLTSPQTMQRLKLATLGIVFLTSATAIVAFTALVPSEKLALAVGQVASEDILAPISLTYESDVLTRLARQAAADSVREVYDPPNPAVLRQQIQLARNILNYIDNVRHDTFGTPEERLADLRAITDLNLPDAVYASLLRLSDDEWREVDSQVVLLLERTMRGQIRDDDLPEVMATLPNLVGFSVSEKQAGLIVAIVQELIRPNAFYNEERTRASRRAAADAVRLVTRSYVQGQVVVRAGTIVTEADMEAMTQLKLLQPQEQRIRIFAGALLAVLLISALGAVYLRRFHADLLDDPSRLVLICGMFLLFLAGARLLDGTDPFLSHLYPAAAFTLIVVAIADAQLALATTAALAVLIGLVTNNSLEFAVLVGAGGVAGTLTLRRVERLNAYFAAGLTIGLVNVAVGLLFGLVQQNTADSLRVMAVVPAGLVSGMLAAGLGLVGLYLSSNLLNLPTSIKLLELSQPGQPLLQRLLREAPGTYQHSLQVANLAELAAERIGANAALVRVGALYHDIGKLAAPLFFAENQADGVNPHESLDPQQSARIIIAHVTDGEKLARKYRLPGVFIDFILEHHGTTQALYFYSQAVEAAGGDESKVDVSLFTYPGPRPQTRESAVLMLADTSESVIRSRRTRDKQEIAESVRQIIQSRLNSGQLDDSGLTVNDLRIIQEVFVSSLQGVFHPRIVYPLRMTQEMQPMTVLSAAGQAVPPMTVGSTKPASGTSGEV